MWPSDTRRYWFRCPAGLHPDVLRAPVAYRGCHRCVRSAMALPEPGDSFGDLHPEWVERWHPENPVTPFQVRRRSRAEVRVDCGRGHDWLIAVAALDRGAHCPECRRDEGYRVKPGPRPEQSFAALRPHDAANWAQERNGDVTPEDVFPGSNDFYWFRCPRGRHPDIYRCPNAYRGCNLCNQARSNAARPGHSFGDARPEVVHLWHPDNDFSLFDVKPNCTRVGRWRCARGHQWECSPFRLRKVPCVECERARYAVEDSLAALYPAVAATLSAANDQRAEEIAPHAGRVHLWSCGAGHDYPMSASMRVSGRPCTVCVPVRRTGSTPGRLSWEETVTLNLIEALTGLVLSRSHRLGPHVRADGAVEDLRIAVDYDGAYWHSLETSEEKDRRKSERAVALGWRLVRLREFPLQGIEGIECAVLDGSGKLRDLALVAARMLQPERRHERPTDAEVEVAQERAAEQLRVANAAVRPADADAFAAERRASALPAGSLDS